MFQRRRTPVNHTAPRLLEMMRFFVRLCQTTISENKYRGLGFCDAPPSHSSGSSPFLPFLPFSCLSITLPPSTAADLREPSVKQRDVTAVSFDALQPKYAVLFFKTLSIRLNEACVSCLFLGLWRWTVEILYILGLAKAHTHTHIYTCVESLSLCLNFCVTGNEMYCRVQQIKVGNEHHPSPERWKTMSTADDFQGPFHFYRT